jgi:hypothetical protein
VFLGKAIGKTTQSAPNVLTVGLSAQKISIHFTINPLNGPQFRVDILIYTELNFPKSEKSCPNPAGNQNMVPLYHVALDWQI